MPRWDLNGDGVADAFPNLPAWATAGRTWAPTVVRDGDGYTLFYSATHRRSGRQCIGRARSASPTGPFLDRRVGPILCQVSMGGSIDPYVFRNRDGARYLYWKNDGNCCGNRVSLWGRRLSPDEELTGRPHRLISYDRNWERPLIENPAMTRSPDQGGEYRLFYAANWYDSPSYARCTRPLGPCVKVTTSRPWHTSTDFAYGPGGAAFFTDTAGRNWMALHGWARPPDRIGYGNGGRRSLFIEKVDFSTGKPRVNTTCPYAWHRNAPHPFVDLPAWANAAVTWAWNQRVVVGFDDAPDRRFRPDWAVTRGDAVALLRRSDPPGSVTRLTQGDNPLTRGQAARLLYAAAGSPSVSGPGYDHPSPTWAAPPPCAGPCAGWSTTPTAPDRPPPWPPATATTGSAPRST